MGQSDLVKDSKIMLLNGFTSAYKRLLKAKIHDQFFCQFFPLQSKFETFCEVFSKDRRV